MVNRDQNSPHAVRVSFEDSAKKQTISFSGAVTSVSFGSEQYEWKNEAANSRADPDGPPVRTVVSESRQRIFLLPKASITVLRGDLERAADAQR
jgi:hypothetical protein